ncbi:hypothetical protein AAFF_G00189620, partial [Aldrovandia affinis]
GLPEGPSLPAVAGLPEGPSLPAVAGLPEGPFLPAVAGLPEGPSLLAPAGLPEDPSRPGLGVGGWNQEGEALETEERERNSVGTENAPSTK